MHYRSNELLKTFAVLSIVFAGIPSAAEANVLLLDSFSDDVVGNSPNGAEIGSAYYNGVANQGGANVSYSVFNDNGNQRLHVSSLGPANSAANGGIVEYFPTASASNFQVDYFFRIDQGAGVTGLNAFAQEITLNPFGTNLELLWSDQQTLFVGVTAPGDSGFTTANTGFQYALGTDYQVSWLVDGAANVFSILVNGNAIVSNQALPTAITGFNELAFSNNFATVGVQTIDEVRISSVPLPSAVGLFAGGLLACLRLSRRRKLVNG
jgi:hypothetical protein